MAYERRQFPRTNVNWQAQAQAADGSQSWVRVVNVSSNGAQIIAPKSFEIEQNQNLRLCAQRRGFWPFVHHRPVTANARIVRVTAETDGDQKVIGIRFSTPLKEGQPQLDSSWLRKLCASHAAVAPCL